MVKYCTEEPFPLIIDKIRELEKELSDASWEDNEERIYKLKLDIKYLKSYIELGEQYIVPF